MENFTSAVFLPVKVTETVAVALAASSLVKRSAWRVRQNTRHAPERHLLVQRGVNTPIVADVVRSAYTSHAPRTTHYNESWAYLRRRVLGN